ncbi:RNA methyltransferase [Desulfurivibrio dismutans]|uniref:RNA methyltransferase n=1 Tax=Desulfurivibrio dismutans TaxID=1398908 RepID=UPI0023DB3181|nr:TrmH family RNA methyltransferase [Desulfurivibrio alkaliphilus]MDF1614230.1 TrmH family RNA methyltransferase [Desulfurivibrio alkaliphilus]
MNIAKSKPAAAAMLANAAIVLKKPKFEENIGSAARIAMNMGISSLVVVGDRDYQREKMLKTATHKAAELIDRLERHDTVAAALAPFGRVIATSARQGRGRGMCPPPRAAMREAVPYLADNRVALLFGPEDRGLTNEDLYLCHQLTTIPTADFSSLNLAQAVAVLSYELHTAVHEALAAAGPVCRPALATVHELDAMYGHVEQVLQKVGFLRPEDSSYWMKNIRSLLGRVGLRAKEARVIRGFCRQFLWYDAQRLPAEDLPPPIEPGCSGEVSPSATGKQSAVVGAPDKNIGASGRESASRGEQSLCGS